MAWGNAAAASVLYSSLLKGEERVHARLSFALGVELVAEALSLGEVRGFATPAGDDAAIWEEPPAPTQAAAGSLTVDKVTYGQRDKYSSTVSFDASTSTGNPAPWRAQAVEDAWNDYFASSEQVGTLVRLHSAPGWTGGILVQSLPAVGAGARVDGAGPGPQGAEGDAQLARLAEAWPSGSQSMAARMQSVMDTNGLLACVEEMVAAPLGLAVPRESGAVVTTPCDYFCRCTPEAFISKLALLSMDEMVDLIAEPETQRNGGIDLVCHYCNKHHRCDLPRLHELLHSSR